MIENILFDLDGTLTDPAEGITNSVVYSLKKYGIEVTDKASLNSFIGPPLADSFMKYYGFSYEKSIEAISYYREYFSTKGLFENKVYCGVPEMLKLLKSEGKKIFLATSKPEIFAEEILKHFMIDEYFDFVCGSLLDNTRCDKHEVIEHVISSCKINKNNSVMVGDRKHDIIGAKKSQIVSVGVTYGYGSKNELIEYGANYIFDTIKELSYFLLTK